MRYISDKNKRKDEVVAAYRAFMELSNRCANDYCGSIMVGGLRQRVLI